MAKFDAFIIGLGNPGVQYHHTRHNVGFLALDAIAEHYRGEFSNKKSLAQCRLTVETKAGSSPDLSLLLVKPLTYMNRSGAALRQLCQDYCLSAEALREKMLVIHDDIDLKPQQLRVKCGGGHGGHNGLRDLDSVVGRDYWRLRIGVGRPEHNDHDDAVSNYVLGTFTPAEKASLTPILQAISNQVDLLINDPEQFLQDWNRKH